MNEITDLREIQQVELGILRHLDQVCRENGLHFFLSNGTLLGAVKYEGFIPWDDDIDVFMPRCDYDRLMRLSGADSGPYRLLSQERTPGWRLPFAKLCDLSTCKQETCADFGADIGLDVDIFPLDAWSGGAAQARRCGLWRRGVSASIESRFLSPRTGWRRAALYLAGSYRDKALMDNDYAADGYARDMELEHIFMKIHRFRTSNREEKE